jgi:uncharacterized protein
VGTVRVGEFEWDETKARANVRKHGVTFEEAMTVFLDELAVPFEEGEHTDRLSTSCGMIDSLHADRLRRSCPLERDAATRRDRALHPVAADGAGDLGAVVSQVGLAADEGDLLDPELGHLTHEIVFAA